MRPPVLRPVAALAAAVALAAVAVGPAAADGRDDLTRDQRSELARMKRDAVRVGALLRQDRTDDAKVLYLELDAKFAALRATAADLDGNRYAEAVAEALAEHRGALGGGAAAPTEEPKDEPPAKVGGDAAPMTMTGGMSGGAGGVTFSADVAPTLVNVCGGCHMNGQSCGGFSMNTYKELMDSGFVDPDDDEGGHMARLMGQIDQPKMPPGNRVIKQSQWEDTKRWARAGAKLDKGSPDAPLRSLVPTEAEKRRAAMAKMSDAELAANRMNRAKELFGKALRRETPAVVEVPAAESSATGGLILIGNVGEDRLRQLAGWIKEDAARFAPLAGEDGVGGRGPLTVFVMKSRLDYQEFHAAAHGRFEVPAGLTVDATVSADGADAYVAVQDLRDDATETDPGMRANLVDGLAAATVEGRGGDAPAWLAEGLGPAVAFEIDPRNPALRALADRLPAALGRLSKADDLLTPGTFAPEELPAVGAAIVTVLRKNGGDRKLGELLEVIAATAPPEPTGMMMRRRMRGEADRGDGGAAALRQVYRVTPAQLAAAIAGRR